MNIEGSWRSASLERLGSSPRFALSIDGQFVDVLVQEQGQTFNVQLAGRTFAVERGRGSRLRKREDSGQFVEGRWTLLAPLTGVIADIRVSPGDKVEAGDTVAVIEAMKMLNDLQSKVAGSVSSLAVRAQDRVEIGAPIVVIEEVQQD